MNVFLRVLCSMILLIVPFGSVAADLAKDSSVVTRPAFSPDRRADLRNDDTYAYVDVREERSIVGDILAWIDRLFSTLAFDNPDLASLLKWMILAAIIVFVVVMIVRGRNSSPLAPGDVRLQGTFDPDAAVEDITAVDFDRLTGEAIAAGRYREAIRWQYLHMLQELERADLIDWRPDKTNTHYRRELRPKPVFTAFDAAVRIYEEVWYGERQVDVGTYEDNRRVFDRLRKEVTGLA
ncbi:MAG: DUF4129 domain-containing protein ['Candidatus Kapabacteria' thiocyanatum]|uniref:Protein-glutamine gamma-glutamyltransferase-like C-terminal domain-containing protein n=1 Tax=Candidatus Kapaibacterium thiocyanatum TaxID=1895771 RepID=A0A1M3L0D0_9BACT|nr:DUF4129 domain-containing protein ['Candidatus Kapabacteria' thiocyanatum]OJX58277.1 MAG: hypothetical protein BGO89_03340 ['Candidatus Kapabacteria' thiocyanatum]